MDTVATEDRISMKKLELKDDAEASPGQAGGIIAVPMKEFVGWGGGIDFVRMVFQALLFDPGQRVVALVPRPTLGKRLRKGASAAWRSLRDLARGRVGWRLSLDPGARKRAPGDLGLRPEEVRTALADLMPRLELATYPDSGRCLRAALRRLGAGAAIPCIRPLGTPGPVPWVGYIYDFQHHHFPELFSETERAKRDEGFRRMLDQAPVVICNAEAVRADAERFRPGSGAKVMALPFAPFPRPEWFDLDPAQARARHGLPGRYFIVCNQWWVHKDHPTAFRAFAEFLARGGDPATALACTGHLRDYRDPAYPETIRALLAELGLEDKVRLLGYLPKADQIALVRGSIAVVQPTWFEGGRGGGAVADALAVGVPALASDIPVNREIVHPGCRFFPRADPSGLAALMLEAAAHEAPRPGREELLRQGEAGLALLSGALRQAIAMARARWAEELCQNPKV